MASRTLCTIAAVLLATISGGRGYPNGVNVDKACSNLTPEHGVQPMNTTSPYMVSFTPSSFAPGKPVTVTLSASGNNTFKGFMVQARLANISLSQNAVGNFTTNMYTNQACNGGALVHNNNNEKTSLNFTWNPPSLPVGDLVFRVTFVKNKTTIWVNQASETLLDASILKKQSYCGQSKSCITECSATQCLFTLSWQVTGSDVMFNMSTTFTPTTVKGLYMAVGFSQDHQMGNDSVIGCAAYNSNIRSFAARTVGHVTPVQYMDSEVILTSSSYENGILNCTLKRPIAGTSQRTDLRSSVIVFVVVGEATVVGTNITIYDHHDNDFMTEPTVNITSGTLVDLVPHEVKDDRTGNFGNQVSIRMWCFVLTLLMLTRLY